jgi:hypothetical protein
LAAVNVAPLPGPERDRWARQALRWLQEELAALTRGQQGGTPEERREVRQVVQQWLRAPDLAGVRDAGALALLPAGDRPAWTKLWADVQALEAAAPQ